MAFKLFETPSHWIGWLLCAIEAEKICKDSGMTNPKEYLIKQDPRRVAEFTRRFMLKTHKQLSNVQYSYAGYDEGCKNSTGIFNKE